MKPPRWVRWLTPGLMVLAVCGVYRVGAASARPEATWSVPRQRPLAIEPRYEIVEVASDEQLATVLERMLPVREPVNTNNLVHALRLWGSAAEFGDPRLADGAAMRNYLLDDAAYRSWAGEQAPPLWVRDGERVEARPWNGDDAAPALAAVHPDDMLATLAEIDVPLETPLVTRDGVTQVAAVLRTAMERFHRQQFEYEWSLISYVRYLYPLEAWQNRYGQRLRTADVIEELVEAPLAHGVCAGCHRLEALVLLLRVDESHHALSQRQRRQIEARLALATRQLVAAQDTSGYWTKRWADGTAVADRESSTLAERILATGHHLEWLAYAPPEVLPPRESIVRAGQWLVRAMQQVDQATIQREYGPFSHAARALCLWRQRQPFEIWRAASTKR